MYRKKTTHQMVWQETRQDVAHHLRQISERIRNEVLAQLDEEFVGALTAGKVVNFELDRAQLTHLFAGAATSLDKSFATTKQIGGTDVAL